MKRKLLLLSFIEGAAVMAAELCGAKLLAPIFGSSLFVWASVMGITLAALALGYFFGGWSAAKNQDHGRSLFRILSYAALFILVMPAISYYLIPRISYLPFLPGVVLSTVLLLFLPIFFLGAASPLFIAAQTDEKDYAGKVSGTVYAVSTAGGIVATFLCGFYLIPETGLNLCLIFFGGILFVANIFVFKIFKSLHTLLLLVFMYFNFGFVFVKSDTLMSSDSILGKLEVEDLRTAADTIRILKINSIIQTEMDLHTKKSVSSYVTLLDTLIPTNGKQHGKALVLGLGGGLTSNLLLTKNYRVDGVEFDKRIIDAAEDFFYLDKKVNSILSDARYFLNACTTKYNLVLVDVFKAEEQPSHILTVESLEKLKQNLSDSALLIINWHGYINGERGKGTSILYSTLVNCGYKVKLCSDSKDEDHRNVIFVAGFQDLKKLPYELAEKLEVTDLINTDNNPLLEKYNARANKTWRTSYLRYYQSR
jgi:predicted membrane-bound spermidine synthase